MYPTVLAFEDMQWADASLLDFIEHLLEWSRNSPLYVITAARPELVEQAADVGCGQAQLHVALPRAAPESGDAGAARRPRRRPPRGAWRRRSWPGRRACRCTRSRRCGCCSTAATWCSRAACTGRPARWRRWRCPRPCTRSSPPASTASRPTSGWSSRTAPCSERRSRKHALAALADDGRRRLRRDPGRARAQGGALDPGRPALARARPVRLPAGPDAPGRLRDAFEARAAAAPPGRRRAPRGHRGRRRRAGRGAGGALPGRLRGGARRRRCRPRARSRPGALRPRGGAGGVAGRARRGAALLHPGGRARGRRPQPGRPARPGRPDGAPAPA